MRGLPGMPDQWNAGKSLCGGRGLKVKFGDGRGGKYLNMKYWELLKEENEAVAERHELAMERIGHMKEEATVGEPYRAFFERTVQFIELIEETFQKQMDGTLAAMSQKEAAEFNRTLYADILPGAYGKSFANPDYAAK